MSTTGISLLEMLLAACALPVKLGSTLLSLMLQYEVALSVYK